MSHFIWVRQDSARRPRLLIPPRSIIVPRQEDQTGSGNVSAFRDVRIVDFSEGVAGPMASMLLGDFEAEVVKVEPPAGDRLKDHPGYHAWNRNKAVVTLDLEAPDGLAAARDLIAGADVAIFDLPEAALQRLALDPTTLLDAHPHLIAVWMPPY